MKSAIHGYFSIKARKELRIGEQYLLRQLVNKDKIAATRVLLKTSGADTFLRSEILLMSRLAAKEPERRIRFFNHSGLRCALSS